MEINTYTFSSINKLLNVLVKGSENVMLLEDMRFLFSFAAAVQTIRFSFVSDSQLCKQSCSCKWLPIFVMALYL